MFQFGAEFIDVLAFASARGEVSAEQITLTPLVIKALSIHMRAQTNGAILYFAPGIYNLHVDLATAAIAPRGPWEGDFVAPENTTLWFEGGARLRLSGDARWVILGGLQAEPGWIFEELDDAMVVLGAPLDAVLPEWWGADPSGQGDSWDAIQRAIETGGIRRHPQSSPRRPLPVAFRGSYRLSRTVDIGTPRAVPILGGTTWFGVRGGNTAPLRGLVSASLRERPSLFAGEGFVGASLLRFDSVRSGVVEDLALNGRGQANQCLAIEANSASAHSFRLRRCAFTGARSVALQLGEPRPRTGQTVNEEIVDTQGILFPEGTPVATELPFANTANPNADLVGLAVEQCAFEVPRGARAIELRATNAVASRFSDLSFTGDATTFIDLVAGTVLIEGSDFANERIPAPRRPPTVTVVGTEGRAVGSLGYENPVGSDVYLRDDVRSLASRPSGQVGLAMVGCTSRSKMVLDTVRPATSAGERPNRSVMLLSTLHTPAPDVSLTRHASARWGRPRRVGIQPVSRDEQLPMNTDMPLCIVGSALPGGLDVYFGASQCAWVCTSAASRPAEPVRFIPVREGFSTPTVVFGARFLPLLALMLALFGCSEHANTQAPGDSATMDGAADAADALDATEWQDALDAAVPRMDSAADVYDGSDAPDVPPPRQWRRTCANDPDGDPTIPPPRLIYPMSPMRVTSQRPRFRWELPPGVTGARVDLCRDPCCVQPIASFDAEGGSGQPAEALPPGAVFWRARGRVGARVGRTLSFTWGISVRHGSAPVDTAWGVLKDFNGDGFDDVITVNGVTIDSDVLMEGDAWAEVRIYWGSPSGISNDRVQVIVDRGARDLQVGDFNGDGMADAIVCSLGLHAPASRYYLLQGSTSGVVRTEGTMRLGGNCGDSSVADYNGDGFSDIAGNLFTDPYNRRVEFSFVDITFGGPQGLLGGDRQRLYNPSPPEWQSLLGLTTVSPGDVNADGYSDLALTVGGAWGEIPQRLHIFSGGSRGVLETPVATIMPDPLEFVGGFAHRLRPAGDLNGDQLGDLVALRANSRQFDLLVGDAQRWMVRRRVYDLRGEPEAGERPRMPTAPDLNGDGIGELVVGCLRCETDAERDLRGTLDVWRDPTTSERSRAVSVDNEVPGRYLYASGVADSSDINGDGCDDLVIGNPHSYDYAGGSDLHVYLGMRVGFAGSAIQIPNSLPGAEPVRVTAGEFIR